jgi:hypothetical protein
MPFCPRCRGEYQSWRTTCIDCGDHLVDALPAVRTRKEWKAREREREEKARRQGTLAARGAGFEELPLPAEERGARWPAYRVWEALGGVSAALAPLALVDSFLSRAIRPLSLEAVAFFTLLGGGGALFFLYGTFQVLRGARRDAAATTFIRYTGPLRVERQVGEEETRWCLILGEKGVLAEEIVEVSEDIASAATNLAWGVVDYTKHARVVFGVRGEDGHLVWSHRRRPADLRPPDARRDWAEDLRTRWPS